MEGAVDEGDLRARALADVAAIGLSPCTLNQPDPSVPPGRAPRTSRTTSAVWRMKRTSVHVPSADQTASNRSPGTNTAWPAGRASSTSRG